MTIPTFFRNFWGLVLLNLLLWAVIPGFLLGNLHVDTLEALYWARVPEFGYWKHPPLTTWLLGITTIPGPYSIFMILLLSQGLTIVTAYFIGRLANLLAGYHAARLAVGLFFVSSLASFYSLQINHNSVLAPFMAATLTFGIEYLERQKTISAINLGLAVGLGAITKYEIIFAVIPLLAVAIAIPNYRTAFLKARSYLSILIAVVVISPHIYWLYAHDFISIKRAADSAPINDAYSLFAGLWGLIWGSVAIIATPLLMIYFFKISFPDLRISILKNQPQSFRIGWIVLFISPLGLLLTGLISGQFVKALWLLPLAPAISIGLGVILEKQIPESFNAFFVSRTIKAMCALFFGFWIYLIAGEVVGQPHEAFFSKTYPLAKKIENGWAQYQSKPLQCVIVNENKIGNSPVLWLKSKPLFYVVPTTPWENQEKFDYCDEHGAIAVELIDVASVKNYFPRLCDQEIDNFHLSTLVGISTTTWIGKIRYLPPKNQTCDR